jgi:16S rRNA (cytosine1402-N4)-methyltransferase
VDLWASRQAAIVVDGTVGRAGHSLSLLSQNPDVRVIALDRDPEAVSFVERRFVGFGDRAQVRHGSYADLPDVLQAEGLDGVDGILLDLGVSSPQLDDPARGFSFRHDGPLDLRFDPTSGPTAAEWLAQVDEGTLVHVLREYGEEPNARRVAQAMLATRTTQPIATTEDLKNTVQGIAGRRGRTREPIDKSLARVFQALRIAVNRELDELDRFLANLRGMLNPGGRIVVLSFQSLEDRRVKHAFQDASRECVCPPELPMCMCGGRKAWLSVLTRRPLVPTDAEVVANPRARSVRLRAAERVAASDDRVTP